MRFALTCTATLILAAASARSAEPAPPSFAKKPVAAKAGEKTTVTFAVDRETDVAVYVEDAAGKVVRHLAAGVLGKNPPEPLKANSLEQSVEWDGRDDDGKPAAGGPFKFRVGAGLKASYAGLPFAEKDQTGPNHIENVIGLAAGPDGRVYVVEQGAVWSGHWDLYKIHVFRRDGSYEKTLKPFPANLPAGRTGGGFVNSYGAMNPLIHRASGLSLYSHDDAFFGYQPAVLPDGRLVLAVVPATSGANQRGLIAHLAMLDADGGIPNPTYAGPALGGSAQLGFAYYPVLAASADGKSVYIAGLGPVDHPHAKPTHHAIYTAPLPERGPAAVWFGEPGKSGSDNAHLNDPCAVALDGKGRLLIADRGNNRILVLNEKDKSFAGSIPVEAPSWVAAHPRTGAVYVCSKQTILIKFSGWENPKELARSDYVGLRKGIGKEWWWGVGTTFAVDCSADPAVVWVGQKSPLSGGRALVRCEDLGDKFSDAVPAKCFFDQLVNRPTSDPTHRLVACATGTDAYGRYPLRVLDEETGKIRDVPGLFNYGRSFRLGPDGSIYAQDHWEQGAGICRWDRDGKPVPFAATLQDPWLRGGRLVYGCNGTTAWERDFGVARNGDLYVKAQGAVYHGLHAVHVYDRDGNLKRIAVHETREGGYGPRVDARGNIYLMEPCKDPAKPWPDEFAGRLSPVQEMWFDNIYGSIVKFGPEGGAIWNPGDFTAMTYEGWGIGYGQAHSPDGKQRVSDFRTTGGALAGTFARGPATLAFPRRGYDTAAFKKISVRLKNDSGGDKATLTWFRLGSDVGFTKSVAIKPNSDFAEYVFDLSGEAEWKGVIWRMNLCPTSAAAGSFRIDWVRLGEGGGATVWNFDAEDAPERRLPATMKREKLAAHRQGPVELQGARWWKPGFSPVLAGAIGQCQCTGSDFDVDDFGRVFAPDTGRFRVGVLDTNGNEIISIGGYGNQDNCGPDSHVMDPAGKFLRPRKADDPKDLVSPFAKPEIAFGWIVGVAVTDKHAYVDDVMNKRILRVKLDYAAVEAVAAP
ncbi:MAG TPA: hypothetical protein PK280_03905 [Planctomycetota bacterium]|nr:hypothetical protein [Planctomycetota bacterium]